MNARESLSNAKNSVRMSAEANRRSVRPNFLPIAPIIAELVSAAADAMTTTGTTVAVLAVLGLYTSVLTSSKDSGMPEVFANASFHSAGDVVLSWETELRGLRDRVASDCVNVSILCEEVECSAANGSRKRNRRMGSC